MVVYFRKQYASIFLRISGLFLLFAMLLSHSMFKRLDHDEHQFIASGALLSRYAIFPYRDYPYFHTPYLAAIYAAIFLFTAHLLLAARIFSTICGFLTVVLVGWTSWNLLEQQSIQFRRLVTFAVVLILIGNPVFIFTSGRSWNHDLPTLLTLIAFLLVCRGINVERASIWKLAMAGMLMGIAVGVRLTFAPAAAMMPIALFNRNGMGKRKIARLAAAYLLGLGIALIPMIVCLIRWPEQFVFGNFQYPFFNTSYRAAGRYHGPMTGLEKLDYLISNVLLMPGNFSWMMICIVAVGVLLRRHLDDPQKRFEAQLLMLMLLMLLIGVFAPTPLFTPYFYALIPFALLTAVYAMAGAKSKGIGKWRIGVVLGCIVSLPYIVGGYDDLPRIGMFRSWVPMQIHEQGVRLAAMYGHGRVLTLEPIVPLEGCAEIYPELATGPFAWRVGPFVDDEVEARIKILDADDLITALPKRPPEAMLIGTEGDLEEPISCYAIKHHMPLLVLGKSGGLSVPCSMSLREDATAQLNTRTLLNMGD